MGGPNRPVPVTELLQKWQEGDRAALDELIPLVYDELHRIASRYRAREWRDGTTVQTTALVNDAYIKLVDQSRVDWQNRAQFFAIAARLIRRILVDGARRRRRDKRGGDAARVTLDTRLTLATPDDGLDAVDVIAVDRALQRLEAADASLARVVELRFFGGMTVEETAAVLQVSKATVKRDWAVAKALLYRDLTGNPPGT